MSEPGDIKQKDLFPRNGIKPTDARRIRETLLTEEDWYKEGVTIWIRPSGIQRLAIAEEEPRLAQRFVELFVLRPANNRRYVQCRMHGVSEKLFYLCSSPRCCCSSNEWWWWENLIWFWLVQLSVFLVIFV